MCSLSLLESALGLVAGPALKSHAVTAAAKIQKNLFHTQIIEKAAKYQKVSNAFRRFMLGLSLHLPLPGLYPHPFPAFKQPRTSMLVCYTVAVSLSLWTCLICYLWLFWLQFVVNARVLSSWMMIHSLLAGSAWFVPSSAYLPCSTPTATFFKNFKIYFFNNIIYFDKFKWRVKSVITLLPLVASFLYFSLVTCVAFRVHKIIFFIN